MSKQNKLALITMMGFVAMCQQLRISNVEIVIQATILILIYKVISNQ